MGDPLFGGGSKGEVVSIALLAKRCESLRPWRFPKAEPLAAGVKRAFRNALCPVRAGARKKRKEFYFIKPLSGRGVEPLFCKGRGRAAILDGSSRSEVLLSPREGLWLFRPTGGLVT